MSTDLAPIKPLKMTAGEVREALKRYYPHPEYGLVFEIAKSTGHAANRHLDAMAMSLWPSRGLHIYGIEIKVNFYDWKREKETPQKAEELAKFCDFFYVAAPRGIIPINEVPPNWGLIEVRENKTVEAKAPAQLMAPEMIGRHFLAAVFRAASRGADPEMLDAARKAHCEKADAEFEGRVKAEVERQTKRDTSDADSWRKVLAALGENPNSSQFISDDSILAAIKAVRKAGVVGSWNGLKSLHGTLENTLTRIRGVMSDMDIGVKDAAE